MLPGEGADFSENYIKNNGRSKPLPYTASDSREGCPYGDIQIENYAQTKSPL